MATDLKEISGIAERTAELLKENGFPSVEAIAKSTVENLAKARGFSVARAEKTIQLANEILSAGPVPTKDRTDESTGKNTAKISSKKKSASGKNKKKEKNKDKKKGKK